MGTKICYPHYWQIYQHEGDKWYHLPGKRSVNEVCPQDEKPLPKRIEALFGLTPQEVVNSLFKVNGGWQGLYIANLKERKYFYCGTDWEDVVNTFEMLGVTNRHITLVNVDEN